MEGTLRLLELARDKGFATGQLPGLFHIAIGRVVTDADGKIVSSGVTWRTLSSLLKDAKYDRELVRELGGDPDVISPKDREKLWYHAIGLAKVDSAAARAQAEHLTNVFKPLGFIVGSAPGGPSKLANLGPPPVPISTEQSDDSNADVSDESHSTTVRRKTPKPKP